MSNDMYLKKCERRMNLCNNINLFCSDNNYTDYCKNDSMRYYTNSYCKWINGVCNNNCVDSNQNKPNQNKPNHNQSNHNQSNQNKPNHNQSNHNQSNHKQSNHNQSNHNQSNHK